MDPESPSTELAAFWYRLPEDAIAQSPVDPRDQARLLDTRSLADHRVADLDELLEPDDVVVINTTRVRRARLRARKGTGGSVELLLLAETPDGWESLVRPARRIRRGTRLIVAGHEASVVRGPEQGRVVVRFPSDVDVEALAGSVGQVPLPPYIREQIDPNRYQTVYASRVGSAAAPTAGLHLTPALLGRLEARGIAIATIDLEVGLGTFRPISASRLDDHRMHPERYTVPEETAVLVNSGRRTVAIGTTVVRALESAAHTGRVQAGSRVTDLFIRPGHVFQSVDLLMTNFHVPASSLLVMLAAFMGPGWRDAYATALQRGYRFLSLGDAMLCERAV